MLDFNYIIINVFNIILYLNTPYVLYIRIIFLFIKPEINYNSLTTTTTSHFVSSQYTLNRWNTRETKSISVVGASEDVYYVVDEVTPGLPSARSSPLSIHF